MRVCMAVWLVQWFRLCCQLFKKCVVHVARCGPPLLLVAMPGSVLVTMSCPVLSPCLMSRGVLVTMPYPEVCLIVFAPRVLLCGSCCQCGSSAALTMGPPTRMTFLWIQQPCGCCVSSFVKHFVWEMCAYPNCCGAIQCAHIQHCG